MYFGKISDGMLAEANKVLESVNAPTELTAQEVVELLSGQEVGVVKDPCYLVASKKGEIPRLLRVLSGPAKYKDAGQGVSFQGVEIPFEKIYISWVLHSSLKGFEWTASVRVYRCDSSDVVRPRQEGLEEALKKVIGEKFPNLSGAWPGQVVELSGEPVIPPWLDVRPMSQAWEPGMMELKKVWLLTSEAERMRDEFCAGIKFVPAKEK
jgi:hypothetical protein